MSTSAFHRLRSGFPPILPFILALACAHSAAQTNTPVTQLLFEPVPLHQARQGPPTGLPFGHDAVARESQQTPPAASPNTGQLELIREIERYLDSMEESEAEAGPYSPELMENLLSVGKLYQAREQHADALRALRRAHGIMRVNSGLSAMEQVPVIEALVESYAALERYSDADEMQELIFSINQNAHGENSPDLVPALARLGDWNVKAFLDRSNILTNINRIDAQRFMMDPNNYTQPIDDPRSSPLFKLYQAQGNFLKAIDILIKQRDYGHPDLQELERKLLTTYFLRTHRENILYEPDFYLTRKKRKTGSRLNQNSIELMNSEDYERGQAALKRSIVYQMSGAEPSPAPLAEAMLEEADWDLLYSRKVRAARRYQEIHEWFAANPAMAEGAAQVLHPPVPKVLPVYLPPPNSREKLGIPPDEKIDYLGHFDVSFSLDKYGKAKKIKVLGKDGQVTRNMEIRLNQYLRNVQFRPRFSDGEPDTGVLELRYYVGS